MWACSLSPPRSWTPCRRDYFGPTHHGGVGPWPSRPTSASSALCYSDHSVGGNHLGFPWPSACITVSLYSSKSSHVVFASRVAMISVASCETLGRDSWAATGSGELLSAVPSLPGGSSASHFGGTHVLERPSLTVQSRCLHAMCEGVGSLGVSIWSPHGSCPRSAFRSAFDI